MRQVCVHVGKASVGRHENNYYVLDYPEQHDLVPRHQLSNPALATVDADLCAKLLIYSMAVYSYAHQ
jgi:hypothetical protein